MAYTIPNYIYNQGTQPYQTQQYATPNWYYVPTVTTTTPTNPIPSQQQNGNNQMLNANQNSQGVGINWVQGEAGARSYPVAPNQNVMLMDSEESVFYIKAVDSSGMPLPLRIFDYKERKPSNTEAKIQENQEVDMSRYITRDEFEKRIGNLKHNKKVNNNGKSAIQSSEQ